MESMVQSQLQSEATSLRAQGSFVPVLKPSNFTAEGASETEGKAGDIPASEMVVSSSIGNERGEDRTKEGGDIGSGGSSGGMDLGTTWGDLSNGQTNSKGVATKKKNDEKGAPSASQSAGGAANFQVCWHIDLTT